MPDRLGFTIRIDVRISDINYGGHLGNDSLISMLHEARTRLLNHHQLSEKDCGGGIGIVLGDLEITYNSEAFHGETLEIATGVIEITRTGARLGYRVTRCADSQEIARATSAIIFFDYTSRRPTRTPLAFSKAFSQNSTE